MESTISLLVGQGLEPGAADKLGVCRHEGEFVNGRGSGEEEVSGIVMRQAERLTRHYEVEGRLREASMTMRVRAIPENCLLGCILPLRCRCCASQMEIGDRYNSFSSQASKAWRAARAANVFEHRQGRRFEFRDRVSRIIDLPWSTIMVQSQEVGQTIVSCLLCTCRSGRCPSGAVR
jgi:hypothetical protein